MQTTIEDIKPGKFYVCQYDNDWYFCVANYVSSEHGDINMKFLHPIEDIYCEVAATSTSSTGRFYCFEKKTVENFESYFN